LFLIAVCAMAGARTARAHGAAGILTGASGQVQIERGGAILAATPGTPIVQGDTIVCGADGQAVVILTDQSRLELRPSTTITLDQYTTGGATPTRVGLGSGILRSVVNGTRDAPADYQVHTPNAIVTVQGTDFYAGYIQSSPKLGNLPKISDYTTEVDVLDGTVNLAQAAEPDSGVDVWPGSGATVAGHKPPWCRRRKFNRDHDRDCDRDCDRWRDRDRDRDRDCRRDCAGDRDCDRDCERWRDRDRDHDRDCRRDCDRGCRPRGTPYPTRTPIPRRTPHPTRTPHPRRTPKPTPTPKPTRTPKPTPTPTRHHE
jgi:hypothetical protein